MTMPSDLLVVDGAAILVLAAGVLVRFTGLRIDFGPDSTLSRGTTVPANCAKNLEIRSCKLDFIKSNVIGKQISSAADFGAYLEVGVDRRFNLGIHVNGFHLMSTETPLDEHRL